MFLSTAGLNTHPYSWLQPASSSSTAWTHSCSCHTWKLKVRHAARHRCVRMPYVQLSKRAIQPWGQSESGGKLSVLAVLQINCLFCHLPQCCVADTLISCIITSISMLHSFCTPGFKSFRDKTIVGPLAGFTCIVGPNGCGKSVVVRNATAFAAINQQRASSCLNKTICLLGHLLLQQRQQQWPQQQWPQQFTMA